MVTGRSHDVLTATTCVHHTLGGGVIVTPFMSKETTLWIWRKIHDRL